MVAAAVIGAGVLGAGATMYGASKAADAQTAAAAAANAQQTAMYNTTRKDLAPYREAGYGATNMLTGQMDYLTKPFQMTQANLEATPGYQFTLGQGLKAVQNSAAARGLGISGAALKGATAYATGLADSTYRSQFDMDQANRTNTFNRLMTTAQLGANAANQTGMYGTTTATNIGNNLMGAGNAQAGAYMASGNAVAGIGNGLANYYMTSDLMQQNALMRGGMYGSGVSPSGIPGQYLA